MYGYLEARRREDVEINIEEQVTQRGRNEI
jgi:hypothetical protein